MFCSVRMLMYSMYMYLHFIHRLVLYFCVCFVTTGSTID